MSSRFNEYELDPAEDPVRHRDTEEVARLYIAEGPNIREASADEKLAVLNRMEKAVARQHGRYAATVVKHEATYSEAKSAPLHLQSEVVYYVQQSKPFISINSEQLKRGSDFRVSIKNLFLGQRFAQAAEAVRVQELRKDSRYSEMLNDYSQVSDSTLKRWQSGMERFKKEESFAESHPLNAEFQEEAKRRMSFFYDKTQDAERQWSDQQRAREEQKFQSTIDKRKDFLSRIVNELADSNRGASHSDAKEQRDKVLERCRDFEMG